MWKVTSEVSSLSKVLLHRPGKELENLIPRYLEDLLFDEIPWLERAQAEHDGFATVLKQQGIEVLYVLELMEDILKLPGVKEQLIEEHLAFTRLVNKDVRQAVYEYLLDLGDRETLKILTAGLAKEEISQFKSYRTLSDLTVESYPFYLDPMPSMYFTRDHGAMVEDKLLVSSMFNFARRRETIFLRFLQQHHPLFQKQSLKLWFDEEVPTGLEGGDVLVLNNRTLCIGLSERTTEEAIEHVAERFLVQEETVDTIVVIQIPAKRAYMHLDTVFTMVDYDTFLMYPGIKHQIEVFTLTRGTQGRIHAENAGNLEEALSKALGISSVKIIYSGDDNPITAAREQWADSTNTLAIAPGVVVTYNRNQATNRMLRRHGIEVLEIEGSELVRGRGGPRCMSMPLSRK